MKNILKLSLFSACAALLAACGSPSDAYGVNEVCQGDNCPYLDYGVTPKYPFTWDSAEVLKRECRQIYYYDFDSDKLVEDIHRKPLGALSQYLVENSGSTVTLVGNTDRCGTAVYNNGLSNRRAMKLADAVRTGAASYAEAHSGLVDLAEFDKAINGHQRVKAYGVGMTKPAEDCGKGSTVCTLEALGISERACAPARTPDSLRAGEPDKRNRRVEALIHDPTNGCYHGKSNK